MAREFSEGYNIGAHPLQALKRKLTPKVNPNSLPYSPYGQEYRWPQQNQQTPACSKCNQNYSEGTDQTGEPICSQCAQAKVSPTPAKAAFNLKNHKSAQSFILEKRQVKIHPNLLSIFQGDEDALEDFIEGLSKHEKGIIGHHCDDLDQLKGFVVKIIGDIEDSAKQLEMDG